MAVQEGGRFTRFFFHTLSLAACVPRWVHQVAGGGTSRGAETPMHMALHGATTKDFCSFAVNLVRTGQYTQVHACAGSSATQGVG